MSASPFSRVTDEDAELVTDAGEYRDCGIGPCSGEISRNGHPVYFKHRGELVILEPWKCDGCNTQGNLLRRRSDGEVVRLSHIHTGNGFEYPLREEETDG